MTPSSAFAPWYRYIDRLPEPDRTLFVRDLQRYLTSRFDAPRVVTAIRRPR